MTQSPLAVSMGDPCGIGPDIILKAWAEYTGGKLPDFVVTGSVSVLKERAKSMGIRSDIKEIKDVSLRESGAICVLDVGEDASGTPGKATFADAKATIGAIDKGVSLVTEGSCSALVTCPINKDVLYQIGFNQPGHTEYLGELVNRDTGKQSQPVMMIAGPQLKTVPVTIHIPVTAIADHLTKDLIISTVEIVYHDLKERFGVDEPRIAVAGLNPHAGENGALGLEEIEIIVPALDTLRANGIRTIGPLPADTMFHQAARTRYDVAVCMYHDQALIPAKMIGFEDGVNVTLGLPFVRTSPDHGTAYDIAGTGQANCSSFVAAMNMAFELTADR